MRPQGLFTLIVLAGIVATDCLVGQVTCPPPSQPAPTVPQFRDELPGQSIWPLDALGQVIFQPASPIDEDRNSTTYNTFCIPGAIYGLELFQDVAAVEGEPDWLFVAYNAGIQVWDLSQTPDDPRRDHLRDGWQGHFQIFPNWGEGDTYIEAIDAVKSPVGDVIYIAAAGPIGHGLSTWRFDPNDGSLIQTFQDAGRGFRDVELVAQNGRVYALAADPSDSLGGVVAFDVTAADTSPCFDDTWPTICPMLLGHFGTMTDAAYVDTLERGGELFVVASDGSPSGNDPLGVEIWRANDLDFPSGPPAGDSQLLFSGLESNHRGVQLFEVDGRPLLATIHVDAVPAPNLATLRLYDVTSCLVGTGCTEPDDLLWSLPLPRVDGNYQYLDASKSGSRTFLYYGLETTPIGGTRVEQLLDVTGLGPSGNGQVFELTDTGADYTDPTTSAQVDYWGDYYGNNTYGLDNLLPRHGIFVGEYFYRVAVGVFDVHRYQPPADLLIDGFESGDCSAWSGGTPCS